MTWFFTNGKRIALIRFAFTSNWPKATCAVGLLSLIFNCVQLCVLYFKGRARMLQVLLTSIF